MKKYQSIFTKALKEEKKNLRESGDKISLDDVISKIEGKKGLRVFFKPTANTLQFNVIPEMEYIGLGKGSQDVPLLSKKTKFGIKFHKNSVSDIMYYKDYGSIGVRFKSGESLEIRVPEGDEIPY